MVEKSYHKKALCRLKCPVCCRFFFKQDFFFNSVTIEKAAYFSQKKATAKRKPLIMRERDGSHLASKL